MSKKLFKKSSILLSIGVLLSCYIQLAFCQDINSTQNKLNVRIIRNNFAEFSDNLLIKDPVDYIKLDNFFEEEINLNELTYIYDSMLKLDHEQSMSAFTGKIQENKIVEPKFPRIYNVNLSGTQINQVKTLNTIQSYASINEIGSREQIKSLIEDSKKLISSGNNSMAEFSLDKAYTNSKNDSWLLAEIAGLFEQISKFKKASSAYQRAVLLNPKRIELLYSHAICLVKLNQLDKAENILLKVIAIDPKFTLAYYNLGNIYYKNSNYYKALEYYNKSIKLNPMCTDAYYNAAITLEIINYKKLAYKYYQKCINLRPNDLQAQKAVGRLKGA